MKDRLIELIRKAKRNTKGANCDLEREMLFVDYLLANGVVVFDTDIVSPENRPLIQTFAEMPLNEVFDLVKAKQEGRIIVPPCTVGDTIYQVIFYKDGTGFCVERKVVGFHMGDFPKLRGHKRQEYFIVFHEVTNDITHINFEEIGKTIFFTREEAEQASREGAGNG